MRTRGGRRWNKSAVYQVLRNPLYVGKVRTSDGQLHAAEHEPIVSLEAFEEVAASMSLRTTGRLRKNRDSEYILTGLLRCGPCDSAMTSAQGTSRNGKRYRYYRYVHQQQHGGRCPTGHLPAMEIEEAVIAQVKEVATRGEVRRKILDRFFSDTGALNPAAEICKEVLDHIRREHSYGNKVTGKSLEAHFQGIGYGWERDILRLVLAVLLRGGFRASSNHAVERGLRGAHARRGGRSRGSFFFRVRVLEEKDWGVEVGT